MKIKGLFNFILCLGFLFGLIVPFHIGLANIILGAFLFAIFLSSYLNKGRLREYSSLKYSTLFLLTPILISLITVDNNNEILQQLGRRVSFLLCPLVFLLIPIQGRQKIKKVSLLGLYYGVIISSVVLMFNILIQYYSNYNNIIPDKNLLNYYHTHYNFTKILDIHPSYYGMFVIMGLLVLYYGKLKVKRFLKLLVFILITCVVIFLNSRIIVFIFVIITLAYFLQKLLILTGSLFKTIIISSFSTMLLLFLGFYFFNSTYAYQRVVNQVRWELSYEVNTKYNTYGAGDSRMARWNAAIHAIGVNPFLGYGVGNEVDTLCDLYEKMGMTYSLSQRYNSHNQFIGFSIEGGVISGFLLFIFLGLNISKSYHSKLPIDFFFYFSILTICLIENYLIRNAGVIFVAFYAGIFTISYPKTKN